MKATAALAVVALGAMTPRSAHACAGCSNPNLPLGPLQATSMRRGQFSALLSSMGTITRVVHLSRCPDIGPICNIRDEPPNYHDQHFYIAELRSLFELGLADWSSIQVQVPLRVTRTTIVMRREDGTPFQPDYENTHHRNETLFGFGDLWLSGRFFWSMVGINFAARVGVSLPIGRTEPDPFALGNAGISHQHIQFGTGTFDPLLGLDVNRRFGRFDVRGYAQARLTLYENRFRYQAGHQVSGGMQGDAEIVAGFRVALAADVVNEQPERWSGIVQQDGNLGRTDFLVGGGVSYAFKGAVFALNLKFPIYQHIIAAGHHPDEAGQLTYPALLNLVVGYSRHLF